MSWQVVVGDAVISEWPTKEKAESDCAAWAWRFGDDLEVKEVEP